MSVLAGFPDRYRRSALLGLLLVATAGAAVGLSRGAAAQSPAAGAAAAGAHDLDSHLAAALTRAGFTGRIESTLEARLGRPVDLKRADLGRLLFFDKILGLHDDNSCAGCHAPAFGFGDSQRMAIGVQNNGVVGPNPRGPRNQRRSPMVANTPLPAGGITIDMRRIAIAEFQTSLKAANAPLDRYARGETGALTTGQKRGALQFFGNAGCVACHAVGGGSNEMFSDFKPHRIGGPQVAPVFGVGTGDTIFDGPGENEDFGFEQSEGDPALRYMFRTAPLRNLKVAPGFFHNGAFGTLEAAIAHHLDVERSLRRYDAAANTLPADLSPGPFKGILQAGIDLLLQKPIRLTDDELRDLVDFVRDGLFDPRVLDFCDRVPDSVPSGMSLQLFEGCR